MLIALDILLFDTFVVLLVSIIMQSDKNIKDALKMQAYSCIVALAIGVISLVIRFLTATYWVPILIVLIVHTIISIGIVREAKHYGVFEKKNKGNNNANVDVVV